MLPALYRRTWPRVRSRLAEYRQTERHDPADISRRSLEAALGVARRAFTLSPYLRSVYRDAGLDVADLRTAEDLAALPILSKDMLRQHADDILCDDTNHGDLIRGTTGGSTGVPSPYFHDDEWWCAATAAAWRGDEWSGWKLGERTASIWGTPLSESTTQEMIRRVSEHSRNFLFLAGFDLAPEQLTRKLDALYRFQPRLVCGYASLLRAAADGILADGRPPLRPLALISSAEPLSPESRAIVEEAFRAPVYDRYGCRELGIVAQECSAHDGMHIISPHVHLEIDVDGRPAEPGETGRILATLLDNDCFPMVRYEVGDLATAAEQRPCGCGIAYPKIAAVQGRQLDVLWTSAGGTLTGVFFPHLMKEFDWVGSFQVVQDAQGDVEMRVVPDGGVPDVSLQQPLLDAARDALGEGVTVVLRFVDELEHTPSGKIRITQSHYTPPPRTRETVSGGAR